MTGYKDYWPTLRNFGLSRLLLEFKNRSEIWTSKNFKKLEKRVSTNCTSISDIFQYGEISAAAALNPTILHMFKKYFEYRLVLEHVTRSQAT